MNKIRVGEGGRVYRMNAMSDADVSIENGCAKVTSATGGTVDFELTASDTNVTARLWMRVDGEVEVKLLGAGLGSVLDLDAIPVAKPHSFRLGAPIPLWVWAAVGGAVGLLLGFLVGIAK